MDITNFNLEPVHPGRFLKEECLNELGISEAEAARRLDVTPANLNRLINAKQRVSVEMAFRLAKAFNTTPKFWLNLQIQYDIAINTNTINLDKVQKIC